MKPRSCLAALLLVVVPAAGAGVGCSSSGNLPLPVDAGPDATIAADAGEDAGVDAGDQSDAGCVPFDAGPYDDAQVNAGKLLIESHKCMGCHGEALTGSQTGVPSPTAIGGLAYPPNLTSDPATGLGCWTNDQIQNAILNGIDDEGMPLCAPMPVFGHLTGSDGLDATEAQAVIAFLRTLAPVSRNIPDTPDCPLPDAGPPEDAGSDAGVDAASDAPSDADSDASDASTPDGGVSADASTDAPDAD